MKHLTLLLILSISISSCSLFQKPSMSQEEIDAMVAENEKLKEEAEKNKDLADQLAMARMQADEALLKLADCENSSSGKVHIIVGAFKNQNNADNYSARMKELGHAGKILDGPYNFHLVTASSHESIKASLNALSPIRESVVATAWIYIE